MVNLGWLYEKGWGVTQDYATARDWYTKAADKGDASAMRQLEILPIKEAETTGRYLDALLLQEALATKEELREVAREGRPGRETAEAFNGVAWHALFARKFEKALAAAYRALALNPNDLMPETNRAHALMFLGRTEEARALYLTNRGKRLSKEDNRSWEDVIADDFTQLRKLGLTHPLMGDIEKELGTY